MSVSSLVLRIFSISVSIIKSEAFLTFLSFCRSVHAYVTVSSSRHFGHEFQDDFRYSMYNIGSIATLKS